VSVQDSGGRRYFDTCQTSDVQFRAVTCREVACDSWYWSRPHRRTDVCWISAACHPLPL